MATNKEDFSNQGLKQEFASPEVFISPTPCPHLVFPYLESPQKGFPM